MNTKRNPLFVDSTKFHGDRIPTQIELNNIILFDDEELFVKITDQDGEIQCLCMEPISERAFGSRVALAHQSLVQYQFVLEKNDEILFITEPKQTRAAYAIIDEWDPIHPTFVPTMKTQASEQQEDSSAPSGPPLPDIPWNADYASTVESLIHKWGL